MTTSTAFAELAIHLHGAVGLYRESRWLSLIRVAGVSFDDNAARLRIEPIPTPGLRSDHDDGWEVSSIWEYLTAAPDGWWQSYPSVSIDFDREFVDAAVAFAATLPPEFSPENFSRLREFMNEYQSRDEADVNESGD